MADASLAELPLQVALALSLASSSTGTDYDYLVKTAQRESGFRADAKAASSTATGLFQFIEETWIRTIKEEGEQYGLGEYAKLISQTDSGRYYVPDPNDRERILALRKDPHISAMMAGAYARRNERLLASAIGREPTSGELYIAHFLGAQDALRLILLRDRQQALSAPDLFPKAAAANRTIFYRDGEPRSVGEVYNLLIARHERARAAAPVETASPTGGTVVGDWDATMPTIYSKSELFPLLGIAFEPSRRSGDAIGSVQTASIESKVVADPDAWGAEIEAVETEPVKPSKRKVPVLAKPALADISRGSSNASGMMGFGLRGSVEETPARTGQSKLDEPAGSAKSKIKTIRVSKN